MDDWIYDDPCERRILISSHEDRGSTTARTYNAWRRSFPRTAGTGAGALSGGLWEALTGRLRSSVESGTIASRPIFRRDRRPKLGYLQLFGWRLFPQQVAVPEHRPDGRGLRGLPAPPAGRCA